MEWTTEKLAEVARESEWWARVSAEMHPVLKPASFIETVDSFWHCGYEPYRAELLALVSSITSGTIYGTPERCAVCGGDAKRAPVVAWTAAMGDPPYFSHDACMLNLPQPRDVPLLAAAILRARRLLGKTHTPMEAISGTVREVSAPLCVKCGEPATSRFLHTTSGLDAVWCCSACYMEASDRTPTDQVMRGDFTAGYNWLTGKDEPPLDPMEHIGCGGVFRLHSTISMVDRKIEYHRCDRCGLDLHTTSAPEATPPPAPAAKPKGPTCWKCHRPNIIPAMMLTSAPEGKRGDDERPLCYDCSRDNDAWHKAQDALAAKARADLDRPDPHAAWVRKQYQRGPDPVLIGTCERDTFDPRAKR